jgi:hypothetical protein
MTWILGLLGNKFVQMGAGVLILAGLLWFGVHSIQQSAANGQLLKDQNVQIQQVLKDNQELGRRLNLLQNDNKEILIKLNAKNEKVIETHDQVTKYINSPEGQKTNREASPLVKETIRMLGHDD